jgi:hypothetical protein
VRIPPLQNNSLPCTRPIYIVKFFVGIFFQVFDVASLNLFVIALNCQWWGDYPPGSFGTLEAFPEQSCVAMPMMIHSAVAAITFLLFCGLVTMINMAEFDMNPISKRPMALSHTGVDVMVRRTFRAILACNEQCSFFRPILAKFPYFTPKSATHI